jgi:nicotinamidase-related amidase
MTSALLIIDVQQGYFDSEPPPADADVVIGRINALSGSARSAGVPVIFVQHDAQYPAGTAEWELERRLHVEPEDHRVRKSTPDSFLGTDLEELLSSLGISRLVICGYASEGCVDTSVRRAAALGYQVTIAGNAHTTNDRPHASARWIREHHNVVLSDLTSFGVTIGVEGVSEIGWGR